MISLEEYKEAVVKRDAANKIINDYEKQRADLFANLWERFDKHHEYFTDDALIYSSHSRCEKCGAGLAYPKGCGPNHQWTCSNVLKGIGTDKGHSAYPFAFYEIKSEQQPSANGATTRPKESQSTEGTK